MSRSYKPEEILNTQIFKNFLTTANSYCLFVEDTKKESSKSYLKKLQIQLANLYSFALNLQWVELQSDHDFDEKLDKEEFEKLLLNIENKLSENRYYWQVLEPIDLEKSEVACFDLLDDIADIYKDLKYSIMVYNTNKPDCIENALWQFKYDFHYHWNYHCINALRGIYYFLEKK